ncbi:tetratricopeptide repeat protein [Micromonospora sp. M12]
MCLAENDDWESARDRLRETAGRLGSVIGADHPDTLRCLGDLALVSRRAADGTPPRTSASWRTDWPR